MAWNRKGGRSRKNTRSRNFRRNRKSGNDRLTSPKSLKRFAFQFGLVTKGLKNPDSQISASFNDGLDRKKKEKKPLF